MELADIRWAKRRGREGLHVLWDEIRPRTIGDPLDESALEWLAETYRQLVLRHDSRREFELSESFHVGELEVRRKRIGVRMANRFPVIGRFSVEPHLRDALEWIGRTFNAYTAYRWLSFYGTSYWTAAAWVVGGILIFAALLTGSGLEAAIDGERAIDYDWCVVESGCARAPLREWLSDYREALLYTLQVVTFQKERGYVPAGAVSALLNVVGSLLVVAEASLMLLAVRRRFRRT